MSDLRWERIRQINKKLAEGHEDYIMNADDLRMDVTTGKLTGLDKDFNSINYFMNEWAQGQLFSREGMPAQYFRKLMDNGEYELVAEHVNYNLEKDNGVCLIRTNQYEDMSERQIRGLLSDSYSKFDNVDMIDIIKDAIGSPYKHEIIQYEQNDKIMSIRVNFLDMEENIGRKRKKDDVLKVGLIIMNSEVGGSGIRMLPSVYRVVCDNGMALWESLGEDDSNFYRRHRWIDKDDMYNWGKVAIKKAIAEAEKGIKQFSDTQLVDVPNPEEYILDRLSINKSYRNKIAERWKEKWSEEEQAHSMFAIINSITNVAREYEPETRLELETAASKLLTVKKVA